MTTAGEDREPKEYKLTAVGGNRYPSLEAAQAAALGPVARALAAHFRRGLASGKYIVVDGHIVSAENEDDE